MVTLPKPLQVMPTTLEIMELSGLWRSRGTKHRFGLMFGYAMFVMVVPRFVYGVGSDDLPAILKSIGEVTYICAIFGPISIFAAKLETFEQVVDGLGRIFYEASNDEPSSECYDLIVTENEKVKKFADFLTKYLKFVVFGFCLPSIFVTYWRYFTSAGTNSVEFLLPMEQQFYGLQIRTNLAHYHIFLMFSLLAYTATAYFVMIKMTLPLFMIKYSSLTFRLVTIRIRKLADPKTTAAALRNVIELHQQAFDVTDLVEKMCHIPVAVEFITCVLLWCLVLFYIATTLGWDLFTILIVIFVSLLEAFGYSYLGSQLSEQADAVGEACYDLSWYEGTDELKRACQLMIQRSQKATQLTGIKMFPIELETFGNIINLSYSYYLILKDLFNVL